MVGQCLVLHRHWGMGGYTVETNRRNIFWGWGGGEEGSATAQKRVMAAVETIVYQRAENVPVHNSFCQYNSAQRYQSSKLAIVFRHQIFASKKTWS